MGLREKEREGVEVERIGYEREGERRCGGRDKRRKEREGVG